MNEADQDPRVSGAPGPASSNDPASKQKAGPASETPEGEGQALPLTLQTYIGVQLRAVFDDVAKQPVPDRFLELMRKLE